MSPVTDKRRALLQAALTLFLENGFERTKTSEVAQKAGVASGTLFNYFSSKEDLFNTLFLEIKERDVMKMQAVVKIEAPLEIRMRQLWTLLFSSTFEDPESFLFVRKFAHSSRLDAEAVEQVNRKTQFLTELYREGLQSGHFRQMDPHLAISLWLNGFMVVADRVFQQEDLDNDSRESLIEQGFSYLWKGISR